MGSAETHRRHPADRAWIALGLAIVAFAALAVQFGTSVRERPSVRDERLMKVPIDDIHEQGWSVETAIDYQEVKGPAFFWMYAIPAEVVGNDMNAMRLVSVALFIIGASPILMLAARAGVRGPPLLVVAIFYVLLPYNLPQAQLLMSEASFIALASWAMWAAVVGMEAGASRGRLGALIAYAVLLSALLHHRPHAVAIAGAVVLAATERSWLRSWPWWLASLLAGLSRIPLWARWGGLVTSDYQHVFGFGLRPEALVYFLAALVPLTAAFIWVAWLTARPRWSRSAIVIGGGIGLILGALAMPDLANRLQQFPSHISTEVNQLEFAGVAGTFVRAVPGGALAQHAAMAVLAMLGGAGVASLLVVAQMAKPGAADGVIRRIAFWTLATGVPLYVITAGPVYDRYLVVWSAMLPIVWVRALPTWLRWAQGVGMLLICAYFVGQYFIFYE